MRIMCSHKFPPHSSTAVFMLAALDTTNERFNGVTDELLRNRPRVPRQNVDFKICIHRSYAA